MRTRVQIHPWAAAGFGRSAASYERARPGYPPDAVRWLADRTGLGPAATVVDVGAGTGKLTRLLAATGAHVIAVEPLAEMLRHFPPDVPAELVGGTAEAIPLADGSADLVTVAEAFHWFRGDEALAEIHRVLRPAGLLVLVWNRLDLREPFAAAFDAVLERNRGHPPVRDTSAWRDPLERTTLFAPAELRRFENEHELTVEALVDRAASESSIAILPEPQRSDVLTQVDALGRSQDGPLVLRYTTEVSVYERLEKGA